MEPLLPSPKFFHPTGYTIILPGLPPRLTLMNPDYFATDETATKVAQIFGARQIEQRLQSVPPMTVVDETGAVAHENWLIFPAGSILFNPDGSQLRTSVPFEENAGLIAAYFARNPEKDFPTKIFGSLAAMFAWQVLKSKYEHTLASR